MRLTTEANGECGVLGFIFLPAEKGCHFGYFLDPDPPENIKKWLFERGVSSRDGKIMKPQVEIAAEKGANYLMCRIPLFSSGNDTFADYIRCFFSNIDFINDNYANSSDPNIDRRLSGIILFTAKGPLTDGYCVINNSNVTPKLSARALLMS